MKATPLFVSFDEGFFKGCGLCAAPLFVSFDEGSFEGVEKKRKETKRNQRVSLQKTREGDPWKRNEKGQIFSFSLRSLIFLVLLRDTNKRKNLPLFVSFPRVSLTGLLYAQLGFLKSEIRATKSIGNNFGILCAARDTRDTRDKSLL